MSTAEGMDASNWAGDLGRNWLANLQRFESMIAPIGAAMLTQAGFRPGERVIDVGCGGGGSTIAIARAVSPGGHATGLDISQDLISSCGVRASQGTQSDIRFVCADAATVTVTGGPFDRLFSRFGSMFFPEPKPAFRNLRRMVKDGGRIDLAVWAAPSDNPWMMAVQSVIADYVEPPQTKPDPRAPGPFVFADTGWLTEVLEQAGFGEIEVEPCVRELPVGGAGATPADGADFVLTGMHIGEQVPQDKREEVAARIVQVLTPHHVPGKGSLMLGKALLVRARAL